VIETYVLPLVILQHDAAI